MNNSLVETLEQTQTLESLFIPSVIANLNAANNPSRELVFRLKVLSSNRTDGERRELIEWRLRLVAQRAAWDTYISSASICGLFNGVEGIELASRIRDRDDNNFRSGMAECFAAWFLAARLNCEISPRPKGNKDSVLEFQVVKMGINCNIEVKSPYRFRSNFVGSGNDKDLLEEALISANTQFPRNQHNILVIVPEVWPSILSDRIQIVEAFFGQTVLKFPAIMPHMTKKQREVAEQQKRVEFRANGRLLRPIKPNRSQAYTRISAVIILEEKVALEPAFARNIDKNDLRIEPNALVLHNPFAAKKIPPVFFDGLIQLYEKGDNMVWSDNKFR